MFLLLTQNMETYQTTQTKKIKKGKDKIVIKSKEMDLLRTEILKWKMKKQMISRQKWS